MQTRTGLYIRPEKMILDSNKFLNILFWKSRRRWNTWRYLARPLSMLPGDLPIMSMDLQSGQDGPLHERYFSHWLDIECTWKQNYWMDRLKSGVILAQTYHGWTVSLVRVNVLCWRCRHSWVEMHFDWSIQCLAFIRACFWMTRHPAPPKMPGRIKQSLLTFPYGSRQQIRWSIRPLQ